MNSQSVSIIKQKTMHDPCGSKGSRFRNTSHLYLSSHRTRFSLHTKPFTGVVLRNTIDGPFLVPEALYALAGDAGAGAAAFLPLPPFLPLGALAGFGALVAFFVALGLGALAVLVPLAGMLCRCWILQNDTNKCPPVP